MVRILKLTGADMASFSGGEALTAGFRLIARKPGLLLVWAAAWLVLGVLPQVLPYVILWPDVAAAYGPMFRDALAGVEPDTRSAALEALRVRMLPFTLLQLPVMFVGLSVFYGAIYRAVLEPGEKAFGYLRLGGRELWMVATQAASVGLLILALAAAVIVGAIVVMAVRIAAGNDDGVTGVAIFGTCLVAAILLGWCAIRLSLALPMTFAERRFRLLESWALTRGHGWKMFGVMAGLVAIVLLLEIAVAAVVIGVAFGVAGARAGLAAHVTTLFAQSPAVWLPALAPWLAAAVLVYAVLTAALRVIMVAPLADIYRQLTARAN